MCSVVFRTLRVPSESSSRNKTPEPIEPTLVKLLAPTTTPSAKGDLAVHASPGSIQLDLYCLCARDPVVFPYVNEF